MDDAVAAALSALDGTFSLNKDQNMALKAFLSGEDVFALLTTLARALLNTAPHRSLPWGGDTLLMSTLTPVRSLKPLLPGPNGSKILIGRFEFGRQKI